MARQQAGVKATALASANLSITPLATQSFLIKRVDINNASNSPAYASLTTNTTTVGYFRCDAGKWNNLAMRAAGKYDNNLIGEFIERGLMKGYPVGPGEAFTVALSAGTADIVIDYEIYDATDMKPTDANGSQSAQRTVVLYGQNATAWTTAGYHTVDDAINPAGWTTFPFESPFPSKFTGTIHAIMAQDIDENTYSGSTNEYANSQFVRLTMDQEVLFDQQKNGFVCIGLGAAAGSANKSYGAGENIIPWARDDENEDLYFFPEPIKVGGGDELTTEVDISISAANGQLDANTMNVAYVVTMVRGQ